jgi:hypothetical protein
LSGYEVTSAIPVVMMVAGLNDKDDLVSSAQALQPACRVVKFTCLTYDDWTGTDD